MSQVKNDNNPLGALWNSVTREAGRVANEAGRHVTESIAEVTKGVNEGGFIGGVVAAADKLSAGTFVVGVIDTVLPGADLPKPLAEGIAGAVNILSGNPIGFYDLYQAFSAAGGDGGASAPANNGAGQRTQTPEAPASAAHRHNSPEYRAVRDALRELASEKAQNRRDAFDAAKARGREASQAKMEHSRSLLDRAQEAADKGGGFAVVDSILDELGDGGIFFGDAISDITTQAKANDAIKKKVEQMEKDSELAIGELDKILNNPDLSFEDMVFMLMGALMKQSQKEVKGMTAEVREKKIAADLVKRELAADFDVKEARVLDLEAKVRKNPNDQDLSKQLGEAKSALRKSGDERSDQISETNDTRQEQLEAIKNAMNKITEMQQALSNILNSMHQTAMNTIGNIR